MIVILAFFNPLNDGIAGRVIALICGFLSMIFATTTVLGSLVYSAGDTRRMSDGTVVEYVVPQAWLLGAGALLVVLIVAGFIRQMARENRTNLITSLSAMILDGVCSIAAAGWCFLPALFRGMTVSRQDGSTALHTAWMVGIAAVIIVAVLLAVASYRWNKDAQPFANAHSPWLGMGMIPVMLTGGIVGVAALANALY